MKLIAATLLLLLSLGSEANECAQDAKKFCAGIEPGKGQLAKCLGDYQSNLRPACAQELKAFNAKTGKVNPCFQDLAEFCQDVPSDPRRLEYCLLRNESRLSPTCSNDFKKKKGNLIVRDVCAQDVVATCYASVTEPDGGIGRCLVRNRAKLNGHCKTQIAKQVEDMKKKNPCFDETEKYCGKEIRFVDIHNCMEKKLASLTPNCKKVVQMEIDREKAQPCYMDLRAHCRPGLSATEQHNCLKLNENVLSNACRQFRVNEAANLKKMVDVCETDRLKLCPKTPFQDGMVLKCLKQNEAKVSPACKTLLPK